MTQLAPAGAMALFALASGYATLTVYRDQQAMAETEATTTDALTPGQVKLEGRVEALETVQSPINGEDGVLVDWTVTGDTDGSGEEDGGGSERIDGGLRTGEFALADGGGTVRIDPPYGAEFAASDENTYVDTRRNPTLETLGSVDESVRSGDDEGNRGAVMAGATHGEYDSVTLRHEILKPGDDLTVLGTAERAEDGMVVTGDGDGEFLLSDMGEAELASELRTKFLLLAAVTLVFVVGVVYFLAFA